MFGNPFSIDENLCSKWLSNEIFSSGIDNLDIEIEALIELSYLAISQTPELIPATLDKLPPHIQRLCRLALTIPSQYDEACAITQESLFEKNVFFEKLMDIAEVESWEMENEKNILDTVMRCLLTTLLKHTGMLQRSPTDPVVKEIFKLLLTFRNKLINKLRNVNCKDGEEYCFDENDHDFLDNTLKKSDIINSCEGYNFKSSMQEIIHRCLFILIFVKGKII